MNDIVKTVSDDSDLSLLQRELPFIPNIRLIHPTSNAVTDGTNAKPGEFIYANNVNLGHEFTAMAIAFRWHALQFKDNKVHVQSYTPEFADVPDPFDPNKTLRRIVGDPIFADIANGPAADPQRKIRNLWGPEVLLGIPDAQIWAILFLGSPTARQNRSLEFMSQNRLRRPLMVTSLFVNLRDGRKWYEPTARYLTAEELSNFSMSPQTSWAAILEKFNNPYMGQGEEVDIEGR